MSARHDPFTPPADDDARSIAIVLLSWSAPGASWLVSWLDGKGRLETLAPTPDALAARLSGAHAQPCVLLLEFHPDRLHEAAQLAEQARGLRPGVPLLGFGRASQPAATLAALRAGVHDFLDLDAPPHEAQAPWQALMQRAAAQATTPAPGPALGQVALLLGARAGLGVSTLAANLALLLQRQAAPAGQAGGALLDLGLPVADGMLYLDMHGEFSFADGVRNVKRLDHTLAQTAFMRHGSGLSVLPLPAALEDMREVRPSDSVALVQRLRALFGFQVIDLGGFSNNEFVAQLANGLPDATVYAVCDQGIASIVSTAQLVRELHGHGVASPRIRLIVNRFNPRVGLYAEDIAARLELPLAAAVPMRDTALLKASSQGEMLVNQAPQDPYVRAVQRLAQHVQAPQAATAAGGGWLARFRRACKERRRAL